MSMRIIAVLAILIPKLLAWQNSPPASPSAAEAVPLTQIASRDEELRLSLRDISRHLPPPSELKDFEQQLAEREELTRSRLEESEELLTAHATIVELREQAREWRVYGAAEARDRKTLAGWGNACERDIAVLKKHEAVWRATLAGTTSLGELESVLSRVRRSLNEIETVETIAEDRLRTVVGLQARVSKQASAIAEMIENLGEASQSFHARLFRPDAPPIWRLSEDRGERLPLGTAVRRAFGRSFANSAEFVSSRLGLMIRTLLFVALAFAAIRWLAGAESQRNPPGSPPTTTSRVLHRQVALTILMTAPLVLASLPVARMTVVLLMLQVYLVPIVRLLPLLTGCDRRRTGFGAAFYAFHAALWMFEGEHVAGRELTAALFAVTLGALAWRWVRPKRKPAPEEPVRPGERARFRLAFAALSLILCANVLGFLLLSNLLRVALVLSSYIGLVIYTLAAALLTLFTTALHTRPFSSLATVRTEAGSVIRWTRRIGGLSAGIWWLYLVLDLLTIRADTLRGVAAALDAKIGIGSFSLTLGSLLTALAVLFGGLLLARGIRFVLREEVLSRLRLSRGLPETISTSIYYLALVLVFLMTLAAAGVQLDKLTILTGAFGVGVGFGMQNVIGNFVSGLVLQFERPIRVGDVLELGTLGGEVRRIGIRSSLVRTFQGAEVIVPNSNLVSNQVINWTLSEPVRRVELQVPVAYGTPPERVIELLLGVVRAHPEVLRDPEPGAFFQTFGPCSLDFILMFWAEQPVHFRLRSEVAIAVNAALHQAGIEIPLPQQQIRILPAQHPAPVPRSATARG
jgi:small-conductance mechanosensitive channel